VNERFVIPLKDQSKEYRDIGGLSSDDSENRGPMDSEPILQFNFRFVSLRYDYSQKMFLPMLYRSDFRGSDFYSGKV